MNAWNKCMEHFLRSISSLKIGQIFLKVYKCTQLPLGKFLALCSFLSFFSQIEEWIFENLSKSIIRNRNGMEFRLAWCFHKYYFIPISIAPIIWSAPKNLVRSLIRYTRLAKHYPKKYRKIQSRYNISRKNQNIEEIRMDSCIFK